ncbi:CsgG/HfaB family protein [Desulfoluna spongiiphila]|uniref:CsgG/HfaB family protein n=1 Tax=Desulfoluna spongiiphila TaxID=419481 RepID=UPI0012587E9C|nr:CsgG/HfaB family protein [Desulfoluna spongiiphila]VVS90973.1 curli production assembly/transport component csgg [Desulfoluna spongiiphila]
MRFCFTKRRAVSVFTCFFICILMTSCASKLKVPRLKPAEINLSSYKNVTVFPFKGNHGREVSDTLTQQLFESDRFHVLDRTNMNRILKEQNLSMSDIANPNNSVRLGKVMGSSALIFGQVYKRKYTQKRSSSKATCREDGKKYSCRRYKVKGNWHLKVGFKMVDTSTGEIIATKVIDETKSKSKSRREERPEVTWDKEKVFSSLQDKLIGKFMRMIAPYTVYNSVKLYDDDDLPWLETGIKFAKTGDWETAIEMFETAVAEAERNPDIDEKLRARAHYDLGVAYGYSGHYTKALEQLKRACTLSPDDVFFKELEKIKQFMLDDRLLKEQGVTSSRRCNTAHLTVVTMAS